jgi:hypothetical protein
VFIRSPWPAQNFGDRVNSGGIIGIEPGSEIIDRIPKKDEIIDPFDDILDAMVTVD